MATHGANDAELERARSQDTTVPKKVMNDGISVFLLETEMPLFLTDWAYEGAEKNFQGEAKGCGENVKVSDCLVAEIVLETLPVSPM